MEDRDWAISTCGEGIYTYDDSLLDELEDKCISKLSDNDYFGACKSFISISEDTFTFPLLSRIIISLIVVFFIYINYNIYKLRMSLRDCHAQQNFYCRRDYQWFN